MSLLDKIAKEAGVSRAMAAMILSGRYQPKRPTACARASRIREIAARLGHRPNAAARAISTGRFFQIGLLLSRGATTSTLPQDLLFSLVDAAQTYRYHLVVARHSDEELSSATILPKILREHSVDGLLIDYTHQIPHALIYFLEQYRVPAIWLNIKRKHDCVYHDDFGAAKQATEWLLTRGRRRLIYVDWSVGYDGLATAHYSHLDREAGYRKAMEEASLMPCVIRATTHMPERERMAAARKHLLSDSPPDGVVGYSEASVSPFILAALGLGWNVPAQLESVTFENMPVTIGGLPLNTFVLNQYQFGDAAVKALIEKMATPDNHLRPVVVPITPPSA